jgi:transglutaminase-like putative cysteine protease
VVGGLAEPVPAKVYLRVTSLTAPDAAILDLARAVSGHDTIASLHALMEAIRDEVEYKAGATLTETTAAEALAARTGVCQDHAHIFVASARVLGIPARYVTGYLLTDEAVPAAAHHAWAEAYVDGLGWVGFDVANMICPTDRYVRMAAALDAQYTSPIRGSRRGGDVELLEVEVRVQQENAQQ